MITIVNQSGVILCLVARQTRALVGKVLKSSTWKGTRWHS